MEIYKFAQFLPAKSDKPVKNVQFYTKITEISLEYDK